MGGINKVNMETWFSGIPRLGLIMEYGYAFKMHNESNNNDNCYSNSPFSTGRIKSTWHPTAGNWDTNLGWKTEVMEVLHHYAERTPGAYIDVSLESCIVWHYHHADIDIGQAQAKELYTLLDSFIFVTRTCTNSTSWTSIQYCSSVIIIVTATFTHWAISTWTIWSTSAITSFLSCF